MVSVFISSTSIDLPGYRQAAISVCNRLGLRPIAMEHFVAMSKGAVNGSKSHLKDATLYIGIFAHRYGYIDEGKSVTEHEYDYAADLKMDRLCFLVDEAFPWPPAAIDYKNHPRLVEFKERVKKSLICSTFTTIDDFSLKLMQALSQWLQEHKINPLAQPSPTSQTGEQVLPPVPAMLVGRDDDLKQVKGRLGIPSGERRTSPLNTLVIRGLPGVGKTTLINALAHTLELSQTYSDGVLWAPLGENPELFALFGTWGRVLGVQKIENAVSLEQATLQMRNAIGKKQFLMIVDDVWNTADAVWFKQIMGPRCAILFTTRFTGIANELAPSPNHIYILGILSETKSLELLNAIAPHVGEQYPQQCRELVSDLEGLPLAIQVAGRLLESDSRLGWNVNGLITDLREGTRLVEAQAPSDRMDFKTGSTPTIFLLFKQSTARLSDEARLHFMQLSAFAPRPATFDLEAMASIWNTPDARPTARLLADRGLLEPLMGTARFQMHSLLVAHANYMRLNRTTESTPKSVPSSASLPVPKANPQIEEIKLRLKALRVQQKAGMKVQDEIRKLESDLQRLEQGTS